MDFSNGQISSSGRDAVELIAVDRKTAGTAYAAIVIAVALLLVLFIKLRAAESGIMPVIFLIAFISVVVISAKKIIFLMCKKNKAVLEFDADNFIFNGEPIKWADMRKITYKEFIKRSRYSRYNITVHYERPMGANPLGSKKVITPVELTGDTVFKAGSKETAQLIADKFYKYYGAVHGVMLKKSFFSDTYELKQVSGKNVLQTETLPGADSPAEMPQMFR
ncbi:MAG: hypothetical protein FWC57_03205 [Endomicrobia bacterium]|nr:hypothetical protein [Endomicrobiia bacterium]